jgi:hypothetical protein
MGSGVHHGVAHVVAREIRVIGLAVECELEDAHPGKFELVAERVHVRCDQPQILGDKRQERLIPLHGMKEIGAGTGDPLSRLLPWVAPAARATPRERPEMIQPDHIDVGQQSSQPGDAPTIAGLPKSVPVINGVAPKLSRRAEIIGRHAGDDARPALLIQQKQLRDEPTRRSSREKQKRASRRSSLRPCVSVRLEPLGLAEQEELREANLVDLIGQFAPRRSSAAASR